MSDLEVRELRYFVAVAEELNFSRAAERLGIAQPPLSRAIAKIERRLGVRLLDRNTHRVSLTTAGATLLYEAEVALNAISAAVHRTRRAASSTSSLVVTAKPGVATGLLQRIVNVYSAVPGAQALEIIVSAYGRQAGIVREGRADLALLSSPFDLQGLDAEVLATEQRFAAIPARHPLAQRTGLRCLDLEGEPMARWVDSRPEEIDYWLGRDRGAQPSGPVKQQPGKAVDGPAVSDPSQLLEVVGLGQAIALLPQSAAALNPRHDIVYRPVLDATPHTTAIAWSEGARAPSIALFVRVAVEVATEEFERSHTVAS